MQATPPRVILGCGTFGGIGGARQLIGKGLSETAAEETMNEAVRLGLLWWDTAERYADGASERMIGAWLQRCPSELTGRIHVTTKVSPASLSGHRDQRFDRKYIESKFEASLRRLGLQSIAVYLAHSSCEITPIEEVVEGFAAVLASGRTRRIGCCNVSPQALIAALSAADRLGVPGFQWVQNSFSLMDPHADKELRAICRERGIVYSPYSPLAGGILSGKYRRGEAFPPDSRMALRPDGRQLSDRTYDALEILGSIASAKGASPAAVALAWIMRHPDGLLPVVGPRREAPHLAHVSEASELELTDRECNELEQAFSAVA
jgi:aryl-alcohol dehydrogenase-like predicted oxidoreductase